MKERRIELQIYAKRKQTVTFTFRNSCLNNNSNKDVIPYVYVAYELYNAR